MLNGSLRGEEAASPSDGITPGTIPEARSSQTGVSVKYVPTSDAKTKWFVFRASYGREVKAADMLIEAGTYAYVPQRYETTLKNGRRIKQLKSLLPNIVFAYLSEEDAALYVSGPSKDVANSQQLSDSKIQTAFSLSIYLSYYYNHFKKSGDGRNPPLVVPVNEMTNFIKATMNHSPHMKSVDLTKCRFLDNKLVEVIKGEYQGVRGRVARIGGQQCIVASLANGTINVSTAYIPTPYIRVIDE